MRRILPLLAVLVGCNGDVPTKKSPATAQSVAHRPPKTKPGSAAPKLLPQEEAVRSYILANVSDPKSVEFVEWGPHDLEADLGATTWHSQFMMEPAVYKTLNYTPFQMLELRDRFPGKSLPLVRVRFRFATAAGRRLLDAIFAITPNGAAPFFANAHGDGWKNVVRNLVDNMPDEREPVHP